MLPDRRQAERFAGSSFDGFKRLGGTLSQTLKYGRRCPGAARAGGEMPGPHAAHRGEAIRLPALLVIPLILFIMPAVSALVGPSVLEPARVFTDDHASAPPAGLRPPARRLRE